MGNVRDIITTPSAPVKNKGGRPLKYSPGFMESKLTEYITDCNNNSKPVTITGYCQYIGTNRETLGEYANKDEFSDILKRLRGAAENCLVDVMLSGKNPAGAIFLAKNHFNYSDKIETNTINTNIMLIANPDDAVQLLSGIAGYFRASEKNVTPALSSAVVVDSEVVNAGIEGGRTET